MSRCRGDCAGLLERGKDYPDSGVAIGCGWRHSIIRLFSVQTHTIRRRTRPEITMTDCILCALHGTGALVTGSSVLACRLNPALLCSFSGQYQEGILALVWWARKDLNLRPADYESDALTN